MMQPRVILLKEGTDTSQGVPQLISNINACNAVVDIVKTTLGPRGMDKLINNGSSVTITNDGATLIQLLDIVHPAAKTLVDIAKSQDTEVGDGTTSVCVLAGEFLRCIKQLAEDGVHPQIIIRGLRMGTQEALKKLKELAVPVDKTDPSAFRDMLMKCACTALNSKLVAGQKNFFSEMIVNAVQHLNQDDLNIKLVGIKKVPGGSVTDSFLVEGVAFKKTFAYAGFEQQPKHFKNPKIALLNVELELKSERSNAEITIKDPKQHQAIVDAEWKIIYDKLDKIVKSEAKIVLSKLPIGDLATQYFADRDIFCAGRVTGADMDRVVKATGGIVQTSLGDLNDSILGLCKDFEEVQIGGQRFNLFKGCPETKTATIVLRGGSEQFIEESERSLHDAIMIVRRAVAHSEVVGGGGAIEMELSRHLRKYSMTIHNKTQLVIRAMAKALEVIPRQLADNAGFDPTDIVNALRAAHSDDSGKNKWMGVDIDTEGICDTYEKFVWEPALVKQNAIAAASEAACLILSVDETVKNPKSEGLNDTRMAPTPGGRR